MKIKNSIRKSVTSLIAFFYLVVGSPVSYAHPGHQGDHSLLLGSLVSTIVLVTVALFIYRARASRPYHRRLPFIRDFALFTAGKCRRVEQSSH